MGGKSASKSYRLTQRDLLLFNEITKQKLLRQEKIDYIPITLKELRLLPFYCNKLQAKNVCCLTHIAGLPKHPYTLQSMPLMPYQVRFKKIIDNTKRHKFHINKARQMGFSELVLRIFQERGFKKWQKKQNIYVTGTREKLAKKIMARFKELYRRIPDVVENNGDNLYLELKDGTKFEGLPANPEAITGDTKIGGIAMDEAPKWNLVDDMPVMNAYMPIVNTNKSDLFLFGTPKGPKGFFYDIEMGENDFLKLKYNIWETENYLYSTEEIEIMLKDTTLDVEQEFLNQYTSGRDSIFGTVLEEEIGDFDTLE